MVSLVIGALAMGCVWGIAETKRRRQIELRWWGWALTVGAVLYGIFVLELIAGFVAEGAPRAALVMGTMTSVVAVVWAVLLRRYVFLRHSPAGGMRATTLRPSASAKSGSTSSRMRRS